MSSELVGNIILRYVRIQKPSSSCKCRGRVDNLRLRGAGTFRQPCRYGLRDRRPIVANLEYVGNLEEIIELNYADIVWWSSYAHGLGQIIEETMQP